MGLFILLQVALDLAVIAIVSWMLMERVRGRRRDEWHVSRGLQMVTNKIAVLQDLMDRADALDKQSQKTFESRQQLMHEMIEDFETRMHHSSSATEDLYVEAAKLVQRGMSVEEISNRMPIPRSELELIAKVQKVKHPETSSEPLAQEAVGATSAAGSAPSAPLAEASEKNIRPVVFRKIEINH